jgi:hypothetical protein
VTDVRCRTTNSACPGGPLSDYLGKLLATSKIRITDKFNGASQSEDGTVMDTDLEIPFSCSSTPTSIGAECAVDTTVNTLIPGAVREEKRAIWQVPQISVLDAGPNGTGYGNGCPTACGDGDEATFMRQGLFVP